MEQFTNLPGAVKGLIAALAAGFLAAVVYIICVIPPEARTVVLIGLLIVLVLLGLYLMALHFVRKRQAAKMGGDMSQASTVTPRGVCDPNQRAKLDQLRQKFQAGLKQYKARGKDIYKLPWYVVVGAPGAGKTEAIRHCEVGFPPGMHEEQPGTGGTINMNWWFTDRAILLDTAGRLMFEEVAPGATSEWREFLTLLRRSRPNCPINGLMLVIPADSLLTDSYEKIAEKASKIASQLNTIQTALDVRFPVFILITKTDLINGFREFFEHVKDEHLRHQILGWSNPDQLDQPFRPELVDQHLQQVVTRVRRRRLGLLQDPTPRGETESTGTAAPWATGPSSSDAPRRLDEVDSLFSLPSSLEQMAPRLKRYLEKIFVSSEWSSPPLFLRGIYFTSAMRVGAALDTELAQAVGIPVSELPEGRAWKTESSYFLRDLFLEKIFAERGLVTRASNTRTMLRRRQVLIFGSIFVGFLLVVAFSWIGSNSLERSVKKERDLWAVGSERWENGTWRPIVAQPFATSLDFSYNGGAVVSIGEEKKPMKLSEYHRALAEMAKSDIDIPWVFAPMGHWVVGANAARKRAQRIIFEGGVVKPIVMMSRAKIENSRDNWSPRSSEALTFLVRLEGMIYNRGAGPSSEDLSGVNFLKPPAGFLYGDTKADPDLVSAFEWTYAKGGDGRGFWPPYWLSEGFSLEGNPHINAGLKGFLDAGVKNQKTQEDSFQQIKIVRVELRTLGQLEAELAKLSVQPGVTSDALNSAFGNYSRQKALVEGVIAEVGKKGLFGPGAVGLYGSYKQIVEDARKQSETAFKQLQSEIDRFSALVVDNPKEKPFTLPGDIRRKLVGVQQQIKKQMDEMFAPEELSELQALDRLFLEKNPAGEAVFTTRSELYQLALDQLREPPGATGSLIGSFAKQIDQLKAGLTAVREKGELYRASYASEMNGILRRLIEMAQTRRLEGLYERYLNEVEETLRRQVSFPLLGTSAGSMSVDDLKKFDASMRSVRKDLPTLRSGTPPAKVVAGLDLLETRVQRLSALSEALLGDEGRPISVTVTLLSLDDQKQRLGSSKFDEMFVGNLWRFIRVKGPRLRTEAPANTDLAKGSVADAGITLELFRPRDEPDKPSVQYALGGNVEWAILRMLQEPKVKRLAGGKDWEVTIPQKAEDGRDRFLVLLLRFEKPLPDLDQWPNAVRLGL